MCVCSIHGTLHGGGRMVGKHTGHVWAWRGDRVRQVGHVCTGILHVLLFTPTISMERLSVCAYPMVYQITVQENLEISLNIYNANGK